MVIAKPPADVASKVTAMALPKPATRFAERAARLRAKRYGGSAVAWRRRKGAGRSRRARARVGESERRSPSEEIRVSCNEWQEVGDEALVRHTRGDRAVLDGASRRHHHDQHHDTGRRTRRTGRRQH